MARYAVGVEYDGSRYSGWQRQPFLNATIQTQIEQALANIADHGIDITCAGRTDSGVHALCQVFHFDSNAIRKPFSWLAGGNHHLPKDIRLQWVKEVPDTFHARYSAKMRNYVYCIQHGKQPSALWRERIYWHRCALNAEKMQQAAQYLCGEHDFSAFRAADCQSHTTTRYIESINVQSASSFIMVSVRGNAFLHHMVRNIVGSLLEVGDLRKPECWIADVLASKQRSQAGITAPAHGLYFQKVDYPTEFALPSVSTVPLELFQSYH